MMSQHFVYISISLILVQIFIFVCLLSFFTLNGVASDCSYSQNLETGQTYYAYNPTFPDRYTGENHCMWETMSPYVTKINCSLDLPASDDCTQDTLTIKFKDESDAHRYCGNGTFSLEGKNATINLDSTYSSQGGKFLCEIRTDDLNEYKCQCGWKNVQRNALWLGDLETYVKENTMASGFVDAVEKGSKLLKSPRIVGGSESGVNEYPMMAGIVDAVEKTLYCGGTIISPQHILTSAHCGTGRIITTMAIVVGEHDVTTGSETSATHLYRMSGFLIHPNYDDIHNDVAVCKILGTIEYSANVGAACLPFQHETDSFGGAIVTILGWGLLEFGGNKSSKLQKADVNVRSLEKCKQYYPNIDDSNICTYTPGKDSCQMDSGGPILWENPTTHNLVLVGIVASGIGCASEFPSVGTRVGAFMDWIVSVTRGVKYCRVE